MHNKDSIIVCFAGDNNNMMAAADSKGRISLWLLHNTKRFSESDERINDWMIPSSTQVNKDLTLQTSSEEKIGNFSRMYQEVADFQSSFTLMSLDINRFCLGEKICQLEFLDALVNSFTVDRNNRILLISTTKRLLFVRLHLDINGSKEEKQLRFFPVRYINAFSNSMINLQSPLYEAHKLNTKSKSIFIVSWFVFKRKGWSQESTDKDCNEEEKVEVEEIGQQPNCIIYRCKWTNLMVSETIKSLF